MATTYEIVGPKFEVKIYDASGSGKPIRTEVYVPIKYFK